MGIETRFDIDPAMKPDIVGSITDMGDVGEYDLIYCCHTLEHLVPRDVGKALQEFLRVLVSGGSAIILVPDLEGMTPTHDTVYMSPSGPITAHEMFYGHVSGADNPYMRHHSGFIASTMKAAMLKAGFDRAEARRDEFRNIIAVAVKA